MELPLEPITYFWIVVYVIALMTGIRVIMDTHSSTKTSAYLLLILLVPIIGTLVYFTFGVNYRKIKIYRRKLINNEKLWQNIKDKIISTSETLRDQNPKLVTGHTDMIELLLTDSNTPLTRNKVKLLSNGEEKFPEVIAALQNAKNHIHLEYYIFENDNIGNQIKDLLIKKAKEGVAVRLIYDAFGSIGFRKNVKRELETNGVLVQPFYQIRFPHLASRVNFRDHRKIIVVDGNVGFTGGINISDRYINTTDTTSYWRDTHLKLEGGAVHSLQYHFLSSWDFCSGERIPLSERFFPKPIETGADHLVQVVASGPDQKRASIMLAYFTAISMAADCVYLTTPYLIPNESISTALKKAALSGKDVRLLLPELSDSKFVTAASQFYFTDLMEAGVRVFLYHKGFVHSKTLIIDDTVSFIGTANMDFRSFDLNFEINAIVYGKPLNENLKSAFLGDLTHSKEIKLTEWRDRGKLRIFISSLARIFSPLL